MEKLSDSSGSPQKGAGKITRTLQILLNKVSHWFMWLGAGFLLFVTLLTVSDSLGRYLLNSPISGSLEIARLCLVVIAFSAMVYVAATDSNIKVDILTSHFSSRVQHWLKSIMTLLSSFILAIVSWQLWLAAVKALRTQQESTALDIPYAPFKFLAAVAAGVICLLLLRSFIKLINNRR